MGGTRAPSEGARARGEAREPEGEKLETRRARLSEVKGHRRAAGGASRLESSRRRFVATAEGQGSGCLSSPAGGEGGGLGEKGLAEGPRRCGSRSKEI